VTIPAVAPELPAVLVFTGKTLGTEETQVSIGEFVRSLTVGAVENVPIARNCPLSCRLPTVIELGIIVSESRVLDPVPPPLVVVPATVSVEVPTSRPENPFMLAAIVVVPGPTAVASPEELIVATAVSLDFQAAKAVMSLVVGTADPLVYVPMAVNCTFRPAELSV
jgi:branched-subunit amino acid transport protein AzlD